MAAMLSASSSGRAQTFASSVCTSGRGFRLQFWQLFVVFQLFSPCFTPFLEVLQVRFRLVHAESFAVSSEANGYSIRTSRMQRRSTDQSNLVTGRARSAVCPLCSLLTQEHRPPIRQQRSSPVGRNSTAEPTHFLFCRRFPQQPWLGSRFLARWTGYR